MHCPTWLLALCLQLHHPLPEQHHLLQSLLVHKSFAMVLLNLLLERLQLFDPTLSTQTPCQLCCKQDHSSWRARWRYHFCLMESKPSNRLALLLSALPSIYSVYLSTDKWHGCLPDVLAASCQLLSTTSGLRACHSSGTACTAHLARSCSSSKNSSGARSSMNSLLPSAPCRLNSAYSRAFSLATAAAVICCKMEDLAWGNASAQS